jgi:hypothetical protein
MHDYEIKFNGTEPEIIFYDSLRDPVYTMTFKNMEELVSFATGLIKAVFSRFSIFIAEVFADEG